MLNILTNVPLSQLHLILFPLQLLSYIRTCNSCLSNVFVLRYLLPLQILETKGIFMKTGISVICFDHSAGSKSYQKRENIEKHVLISHIFFFFNFIKWQKFNKAKMLWILFWLIFKLDLLYLIHQIWPWL